MAFWDCSGLVYVEFGSDACKEKQNVMRIAQSKSRLDSCHDNARHKAQLIQTLLKDFVRNSSNTTCTHQTYRRVTIIPFPGLKTNLETNFFQRKMN